MPFSSGNSSVSAHSFGYPCSTASFLTYILDLGPATLRQIRAINKRKTTMPHIATGTIGNSFSIPGASSSPCTGFEAMISSNYSKALESCSSCADRPGTPPPAAFA